MSSVAECALFGKYFSEFQPRLERFVKNRLGPQMARVVDPAEVLQDVAVTAYKRYCEDKNHRSSISNFSWWYKIVKDSLNDEFRRQLAQKRGLNVTLNAPSESFLLADAMNKSLTTASQALERKEQIELLEKALEALEETDREILMMRFWDGLAFVEIGEVLRITRDAAKKRCYRAVFRLGKVYG